MTEEKKTTDDFNIRKIVLSMASYSTASILGPLLFFGVIGYFFDKYYSTKPLALIISILVAFVVTNILLFKKIAVLNKKFDSFKKHEDKEEIKDKK